METQINTIFSHGKVKLGKQALATDRRLSGVKKGHFSRICRRESAQILGGGETIKEGQGYILGRAGGVREEHNSKAVTCLYTSPFQAMHALLNIAH